MKVGLIGRGRLYHDPYQEITWADCALRKYLNGEFYDTFSLAHQAIILSVFNQNPNNQWYGAKDKADTQDSLFLLSIEEMACWYLGSSSAKLSNPGKNQRYWFERNHVNNSRRMAAFQGEGWLTQECIKNHRGSISNDRKSVEELCAADANAISHFDSVPRLLYLAYVERKMSLEEGIRFAKKN